MSSYNVEVCVHITKIWVGIEVSSNRHVALWGAASDIDWRKGPSETIGDGFKKAIQAKAAYGTIYDKVLEKERKGYSNVYSLNLADLFTEKNKPTTAQGQRFLDLIQEIGLQEGVDPNIFNGSSSNKTEPSPLLNIAEPIKGSSSAVPWA